MFRTQSRVIAVALRLINGRKLMQCRNLKIALVFCGLLRMAVLVDAFENPLPQEFSNPPDSTRPWVFWHWMGGYISREGITADLEAMHRVGVHGALVVNIADGHAAQGRRVPLETDRYPRVPFMSPAWFGMWRHAAAEAKRLNMELALDNCPGWATSGGPWIAPRDSMRRLVWSVKDAAGPARLDIDLPPLPDGIAPQSKGIAGWRSQLEGMWGADALHDRRDIAVLAFPLPETGRAPQPGAALDLTGKMDARGRLTWQAPAGSWRIVRLGHATTAWPVCPAMPEATGFECDKMNRRITDQQFDAMTARVLAATREAAQGVLSYTMIDSYEASDQTWTPRLREEFIKQRGYDPLPWLAARAGGAPTARDERMRRFDWDMLDTMRKLVARELYARMDERARGAGMKGLMAEPYGHALIDPIDCAAGIELPMVEFWVGGKLALNWNEPLSREVISGAHLYGHPVIGAEAFTGGSNDHWKVHPWLLKPIGDAVYCSGVNQFVLHSYAHQPWGPDVRPGMTMGVWGTRFSRNQTWWETSRGWFDYLARCQFLLRRGQAVVDVLSLVGTVGKVDGYETDACSAAALLDRITVKGGRLVLPDGMRYRILETPAVMTPAVAEKVRDLITAGATVVGPPPTHAPGLADFPHCDRRVRAVAEKVWADCDGRRSKERAVGQGRVFCGLKPAQALTALGVAPDVQASDAKILWTHRTTEDSEIYFIANPLESAQSARLSFRVPSGGPELWHPDTGRIERPDTWHSEGGRAIVLLHLDAWESVFVVFRKGVVSPTKDSVTMVRRDGQAQPDLQVCRGRNGAYELDAEANGTYELALASGRRLHGEVRDLPAPVPLDGPWRVTFDPAWGGPGATMFGQLVSWPARRRKAFNSIPARRSTSGNSRFRGHSSARGAPARWT